MMQVTANNSLAPEIRKRKAITVVLSFGPKTTGGTSEYRAHRPRSSGGMRKPPSLRDFGAGRSRLVSGLPREPVPVAAWPACAIGRRTTSLTR